MIDLSVIIVSYNTRDLLLQSVDSVVDSLEKAREGGRLSLDARAIARGYEIIVVDNASEDGSRAALRKYFPQVRLIQNEFNRGFASACNQAIVGSQGRHLLFLNPDTLVHGSAITELIRYLDRHPRVGAVTGRLRDGTGRYQHSAFRFPTLWMLFLDLFPLSHTLLNSRLNGRYSPRSYRAPFEIDHPLGACMMVRREVVDRVGDFDPEYFMYCEEIDWCIRMRRDRWRVFCDPVAEVTHLGGRSTSQAPDPMFLELFRSRLILFRKHYNPFYRVTAKVIIALGLWWEHSRWLQRYLKGETARADYVSRRRTCLDIFKLLRTSG